jgi:hypothetical protein
MDLKNGLAVFPFSDPRPIWFQLHRNVDRICNYR